MVSTEMSHTDVGADPGSEHQPSHKPIPCTTKVKKREDYPDASLLSQSGTSLFPEYQKKSEFSLTLEDQCPMFKSGCFLLKSALSFPGNASTNLSWGHHIPTNKLTWFLLILMGITQVYWEIAPSQGCKSHSPDLHP